MLNSFSFNILAAPGIILIQDFMYKCAGLSSAANSSVKTVGEYWFTPAKNLQGCFSFWHVPATTLGETPLLLHETNFLFPVQLFHFLGDMTPYTVDLLIHVPAPPLPFELGKTSMKPLVSHNRNLLYHRLKLFMGDVYRQFWKAGLGVIFTWCPGVSGEAATASGKQFLPWRWWR